MPYSNAHFLLRIQFTSFSNSPSGGTRETRAFKLNAR